EHVAIDPGHPIESPVVAVLLDEPVDLLAVLHHSLDQLEREPLGLGIRRTLGLGVPGGLQRILGTEGAHLHLVERLERTLPSDATSPHQRFFPTSAIRAYRFTISRQAIAASAPLLPDFTPARSTACSTVSQVSTPKLTAHEAVSAMCPMPLLTSPAPYSKSGVPPRMTQPRATSSAYWPRPAARRTSPGSSKVPGTRKTSMSVSATPCRISASWAPCSRCSVMKPLNRDTQSANRPCGGVRKPSITRAMSALTSPAGDADAAGSGESAPRPRECSSPGPRSSWDCWSAGASAADPGP